MTLYSFFKRNPNVFDRAVWAGAFRDDLLNQKNYGLLLSACALMYGTILKMGRDGFEGIVPKLISLLQKIHDYATDYLYYRTPSPWL